MSYVCWNVYRENFGTKIIQGTLTVILSRVVDRLQSNSLRKTCKAKGHEIIALNKLIESQVEELKNN